MLDKNIVDLKGATSVYRHEDYLVLQGKDFWVCKLDGTTILRNRNMPNVHKLTFLPQDKLLICGGTNTAYRLFCLKTGEEIWRIPTIKKSYVSGLHFALSHDGKYAYDYYDYKDGYHIVRINLQSGDVCNWKIGPGYRSLTDIICGDASDALYLLRTQIDEVDGRNIGFNEIQRLDFSSPNDYESIYKWESAGTHSATAAFFLGDCEKILSRDLRVYESKTEKVYSLVENEADWTNPGLGPNDCWIDTSNLYICLKYDNVNVVLDSNKRKMAARYAAPFARGCLIGDTYWIASGDKVEKKAFPIIEDIPARKLSTWRV